MAKNKKHIDDLFKDNLQGSPLPLDGSEWDKLFTELHPKKKKPFAWWWMVIGVLLVSALGLLYTQLTKDATAVAVNSTEIQNTIDSNTNSEPVESIPNAKEDNRSEIDNDPIISNESTSDNHGVRQQKVEVRPQGVKTSGDRTTPTNPVSKPNTPAGNGSKTNPSPATPKVAKSGTKLPDLLLVKAKTSVNFVSPFDPYGAPLLSLGERLDQGPPFYIYPMADLIDTLDPLKKIKFIDPYIGGSLGGSFLNQNLTSTIANYEKYRNGNERNNFLPSIGFDIGAGFKGFDVASGAKYLEKGQQSNPNYRYEIYDSIRRVDNQGNVSYLKWNYRDTTVNGVPSPRYRYVSVPLTFGKTVYTGTKLDIAIGVTTNLQFLFGGSGTILDADLSRMSVQRLSDFNRLSLTYGGYATFGYALNDRMKLKLRTRFDADALDMMKHNDISQKMAGFGTDLSLQFKLKK
ncbi:MAG: hypothetical protein ACI8SE_000062 [Bacteroidia bacterium]